MMRSILSQPAAPSFLSSRFAPPKAILSTSYYPFPRTDRSLRLFDRSVATVVRAATGDGTTPPVYKRPPPSSGNYITVLSIDGGGVRGIIPGAILEAFESKLQAVDGSDARIADYFDVIAGTSTGGLVTAMITAPDKQGRPLFTGKDIPKFYLEQCPKIFPKPGIVGTVEGLVKGPKYDGKYLHQLTRGLLKETRLSQAITGIVIPSFDIKNMQPVVFSSFEATKKPQKNPLLSDVCISTSAAPTYLPPYYFETKDANNNIRAFNLTDGGVAANNPTMAAISLITREMINLNNHDYPNDPLNFKKFLVVSLGTGTAKQEQRYSAADAAKWGAIEWIFQGGNTPIIDVFSQAQSDMADFHATMFFQSLGSEDNYLRIQDDTLEGVASSVDNSTNENLNNLVQIGRNLLKKPVSRVNIDTGIYEPIDNGGTNNQALDNIAKMLSDENKLRNEKKLRKSSV